MSSPDLSADSLRLCRFDDGYAPILLKKTSSHHVPCERLEDALDDPLDPNMDFPVEYPQQEDALLLHCRFPKALKNNNSDDDAPMASITGLLEELDGRLPILNMTVYQGSIDSETSAVQCACEAPHSTWTRQPLEDFPEARYDGFPRDPLDMAWVDLRLCSKEAILFPSLTSVAHFFRSLMGSAHSASPWCPHQRKSHPHRIGVLFPGTPPDAVYDVRVGDVCPSWSLYSISRLKIPESWRPWESTTTDIAALEPATLLVFKPLPPRALLGLAPPPRVPQDECQLSTLPKGCLWEVYFETIEEDGEDDDGNDEKKQTAEKRTVRIPHCRMTAPPYLSDAEDFASGLLQPLVDNWKVIRDESLAIPKWTAWPETQHYSKARSRKDDDEEDDDDDNDAPFHPTWNVFPLCHCFPANQPENKKWIDQTCAFVPKTIQLLQQHLGPILRTALFSRLDPETTLEAHTGWSDLANYVIRCHLPLVVPPGGVCGTWVDGCVETHEAGRFLCFDDSKTHRAFNYSGGDRIVLILDLARPTHLPLGTATGGHSDELDQFIAQMNI